MTRTLICGRCGAHVTSRYTLPVCGCGLVLEDGHTARLVEPVGPDPRQSEAAAIARREADRHFAGLQPAWLDKAEADARRQFAVTLAGAVLLAGAIVAAGWLLGGAA